MKLKIRVFLSAILAITMLSLSAQTAADKPREIKLADSIRQEENLEKKIAIFQSTEAQELIKKDLLNQISFGYTIAERYIALGDKEHAFPWLEKMRFFPQIYNAMWLSFFEKFSNKEEYAYIDEKISPGMDSIYHILTTQSSIPSETYAYYSTRLRYFVDNKLLLKDFNGALKHLDLVFKKFKHFNDQKNFYQYVRLLSAVNRHEEAITVFATLYTDGTDFSPELRETKEWLIRNVPNGEAIFESRVKSLRDQQKENFRNLLARSEELYGNDLTKRVAESKYILLSFWGTWCIPCLETHPKLKQLYAQYKDHGLEILSLAAENGKDTLKMEQNLKASIESQKLNWLHSMLKGQNKGDHPYRNYNIKGYPTKILINSEGVIIGKFTGASYNNDSNLQQLLAENMGDEESKARTMKVKKANAVFEDFKRVTNLQDQENLYRTFLNEQDFYIADIEYIKDSMLEYLISAYIEQNNIEAALTYYNNINDYVIKSVCAMAISDRLQSNTGKRKILQENLDRYHLNLPLEHSNIYNQLLSAYLKLEVSGKPLANTEKYLQTLFIVNGFFISDVPTHEGVVPWEESMSRRLANSNYARSYPQMIPTVLGAYLSSDSLHNKLTSHILAEFKQHSDLSKELDIRKNATSVHAQMLRKLMLKKDINGIVHPRSTIDKKYVLLDFWGSWCAPCRAGHPHLKQLYEKYKGKEFEIVAVAYEGRGDLDVLIANWNTAVSADGLPWINLLSHDREHSGFDPIKDFGITAFPTKILIDPQGKVIGTYGSDSSALDAELEKIFGK